tara:strand:+ start:305 stop:505 length:201 start_codon:yes stop_codon:yes gene_type:complete
MKRKYGDEQREAIKELKIELAEKIDEIYLEAFTGLSSKGLGDGAIAHVTQELLLAKQEAIKALNIN